MKNKKGLLVLAILLAIALLTGGVYAALADSTNVDKNTLEPAHVTCQVVEDYSVKNTGDIDAVIRAAVVANWVNADGNMVANADGAYTLTLDSEHWTQIGDYYYYNGVVAPNSSTSALIKAVSANADGEQLEVKVLAEAIQSVPETAAQEAWGHSFNDSWS